MKQNSQNVPSLHGVELNVLIDEMLESSALLGCGSVLNFYGSSSSSPEHSHECVTGFQCSGSEAHLGNCSSPQTLNCSSTQQLSITCLEFKEIRLTEGCDGNVEVFYNGSWEEKNLESPQSHQTCFISPSPQQKQCSMNTPENYDDVIITRPSSQGVTEGVQEEYDDVTSVSEDVRNMFDYDDVEEESNKAFGSVITPTASF
ncbi:scavenger receptor cysteine-rich type 1 M130-like protein [Labeo rohita]|uniref:Scavenger receptor cysteine-rich type 1 M130-like protein n=1 Tax=Labeo rohita TaxID=84645 RepID=A0A498NZN7_LABRO|nr:scavenger receptor cysteine-rich type 1 M130-like protein [Labeo rohita]